MGRAGGSDYLIGTLLGQHVVALARLAMEEEESAVERLDQGIPSAGTYISTEKLMSYCWFLAQSQFEKTNADIGRTGKVTFLLSVYITSTILFKILTWENTYKSL